MGECKAVKHREMFEIFKKYFMKYFRAKNFIKFYITTYCKCVSNIHPEAEKLRSM